MLQLRAQENEKNMKFVLDFYKRLFPTLEPTSFSEKPKSTDTDKDHAENDPNKSGGRMKSRKVFKIHPIE